MRLASVEECRRIDELSTREYGLPSETLMEAAGALAAREIRQLYNLELRSGHTAIVCGPGNNGGDGLVAARHLHSAGHGQIVIFLITPGNKRSSLFQVQLECCRMQGIRIVDLLSDAGGLIVSSLSELSKANLIIDAIFGIGLRSEVGSPFKDVIEQINAARAPVVSLDTPSGLEADRGVALGTAVQADRTLTFGIAKPGFYVSEGPRFVGRLHILPIGFPTELVKRIARSRSLFGEHLAKASIPMRPASGNKTTFGHAAIFAGRPGMWGAALLSASSAYRIGAGYVTLASTEQPIEVVRQMPEILTGEMGEEEFWKNRKWKVAGVGPGLGTGDETYRLITRLLESDMKSVVLDADAITVVAQKKIKSLPSTWILTPHAGELSRFTGVEAKAIEAHRFEEAHRASEILGCIVLLKGYRTVIAHDGRVTVIHSGNSALAKAGTGDVLTGFITGLLAQGLEPVRAAATGAYIHGRLADEWIRAGRDRRSLQASDLRDFVPDLLARLEIAGQR